MPFDRSRGNAAGPHDAELSGATVGIGLRYSSKGLALAVPAWLTPASIAATQTPRRTRSVVGRDLRRTREPRRLSMACKATWMLRIAPSKAHKRTNLRTFGASLDGWDAVIGLRRRAGVRV